MHVLSVYTLDPTTTKTGGIFNGQAIDYPTGDNLDVFYQYGEGLTLPGTPLETPHKAATALFGTTPVPGFEGVKVCSYYTYQACAKDLTTGTSVTCGLIKTFKTGGW